jgi:hypothetical protein
MTSESKSEIVIATVLAAFLVVLWWLNRSHGLGAGFENVNLPGLTVAGAPGFNVEPSPGSTFNYSGGDMNVSGPSLGLNASQPGACNCGGSASSAVFGSGSDLNAFLAANPSILAASESGIDNWY